MGTSWFPPSEKYGIIYEIEHIGSNKGEYPSAEGLMQLISVLISVAGCPSQLGSEWRPRAGCSPYIEFVTDFILPRAVGLYGNGLYFSTPVNRCRLLMRAFEVVSAVITHHDWETEKEFKLQTGLNALPHLTEAPCLSLDEKAMERTDSKQDFDSNTKSVSSQILSELDFEGANLNDGAAHMKDMSIPRAKSPGFYIMTNLLSSSPDSLLRILLKVLVEDQDLYSNHAVEKSIYKDVIAMSLFGELCPSFSAAKTGREYILEQRRLRTTDLNISQFPLDFIQAISSPLCSPISVEFLTGSFKNGKASYFGASNDTVCWREHCILLGLRILCTATVHSGKFAAKMASFPSAGNIVPLLRLKKHMSNNVGLAPLIVKSIQVSSLSELLLRGSHSNVKELLPSFATFVSFQSLSIPNEEEIALYAIILISHICETIPTGELSTMLIGMSTYGQAKFSSSLAARLLEMGDAQISKLILQIVLDQLKLKGVGDKNLAHVLMGLGDRTLLRYKNWLERKASRVHKFADYCDYQNVLDTILTLLSDESFVVGQYTSSLASDCYEVIYHLCNTNAPDASSLWLVKDYSMTKLRDQCFWLKQITSLLSGSSGSFFQCLLEDPSLKENNNVMSSSKASHVIHSISWLLKGAAIELLELKGFDSPGSIAYAPPQPSQYVPLLHCLLHEPSSILKNMLLEIPLLNSQIMTRNLSNQVQAQELIQSASYERRGVSNVSNTGYVAVDIQKLVSIVEETFPVDSASKDHIQKEAIEWAIKWNYFASLSSSTAHLATSWSMIVQTIIESYEENFQCANPRNDLRVNKLADSRILIDLFKVLLWRLNPRQSGKIGSRIGKSFHLAPQACNEFDPNVTFPVSTAALTFAKLLSKDDSLLEDDFSEIVTLLSHAIACYNDYKSLTSQLDSSVAELSFALATMLESSSLANDATLSLLTSSTDFVRAAIEAGVYLSRLSVSRTNDGNLEINSKDQYITLAARTGLSSIIDVLQKEHEYNRENHPKQRNFLLAIFAPERLTSQEGPCGKELAKLTQLYIDQNDDNENVSLLMGRIASCEGGTELLLNAGITRAILAFPLCKSHSMDYDGHRSIRQDPPPFLLRTFNLFNAMLSSSLPKHTRTTLCHDVETFLGSHLTTIEQLFTSYPKHNDLTMQVLSCLCSSLPCYDRQRYVGALRLSAPETKDPIVRERLGRHVIELSLHLARYPFPIHFLDPLPNQIWTMRRQKGESNYQSENCWWDFVPSISEGPRIVLPGPYFGFHDSHFQIGEEHIWSEDLYSYAVKGGEDALLGLMYVIRYIEVFESSLKIESLSLSIALCRVCDAAKVSLL